MVNIGVRYGKPEAPEDMSAWQVGGNMIEDVTREKTRYHIAPAKFDAGTGSITDVVGLSAAIDDVRHGIDNINRHEHEVPVYAMKMHRILRRFELEATVRP